MVAFANRAVGRAWPLLSLSLILLVFVAIAWGIGDPVVDRVVTEALIYVVVVVGLNIFVGNSGIVSFGHISFMLIEAYATAWQTCCPGLKPLFMTGLPLFLMETSVPLLPAALISGLLASAFAVVIGIPLMRLSGALLDRITHHVHILEMNGESYRLKQSRSRRQRPPE